MVCVICNGEPYAAHDGVDHVDVCPGCGACSGLHGGEVCAARLEEPPSPEPAPLEDEHAPREPHETEPPPQPFHDPDDGT